MVLEFRPPTDLVNAYLQRPSPGQMATDSMTQVFQLYVQQKVQEQQRKLQQQQLASQDQQRKTSEFAAVAPYVGEAQIPQVAQGYGINIPTAGGMPPAPSTGTVPSPTAGMPDAQGAPVTQAPSLIDRWQQFQSGQKPTSKAGMAKYSQNLDIERKERDLAAPPKGPLSTISKKDALKSGSFDPTKQMIVDPSQETQGETKQERLGSSLRKELTSSKPYQTLTTAKAAADNIAQAARDPGAYGDLATLFDYMKALDPTSVVREGEQETFRKTGSFTQSMANSMNKLVNGQTITPEQRQEIVKYTRNRLKTAHNVYKNHAEPTLRQAKRIGSDPMEVDPFYGQDFERLIGADEGPKPVSALSHLSTKELQDLRKKMTKHQSNGN